MILILILRVRVCGTCFLRMRPQGLVSSPPYCKEVVVSTFCSSSWLRRCFAPFTPLQGRRVVVVVRRARPVVTLVTARLGCRRNVWARGPFFPLISQRYGTSKCLSIHLIYLWLFIKCKYLVFILYYPIQLYLYIYIFMCRLTCEYYRLALSLRKGSSLPEHTILQPSGTGASEDHCSVNMLGHSAVQDHSFAYSVWETGVGILCFSNWYDYYYYFNVLVNVFIYLF